MKKIAITLAILAGLFASCKKSDTKAVSPVLSAHYLFKPGTYWVYGGEVVDSMYVTATGIKDGYPYMQISEVIMNYDDSVYQHNTVYIGVGPASNQLQLWGRDYNGNTTPQVIFEADTPALGTYVAKACQYAGMDYMNNQVPTGVLSRPVIYSVNYSRSDQNQEYGDVVNYFYPGLGIVQFNAYGTPWGTIYMNLIRHRIIL